jgi:hypothetical protein
MVERWRRRRRRERRKEGVFNRLRGENGKKCRM